MATEKQVRIRFKAQDERMRKQLERINERITRLGKTSQRSSRQVNRSFRSMRRSISTVATQITGLLSAAALSAGAKRLAALLGEIVRELDNIGKTADALGLSTSALQEFRYGFEAAGVSVSETDKSIRRFHQAIGDADAGMKTYARHFENLGVTLRESDGGLKSTEKLLNEVADALERTGDEAHRQLAVRDLFGRAGSKLLVAFKGGAEGVKELRKEIVDAGAVIEESVIRRAEEFQTKWDLAGRVVDANMGEMANSMLELRDALVDAKVWSSTLLADFLNLFTAIDNKTIARLRKEIAEITVEIEKLQKKSSNIVDPFQLTTGTNQDQLKKAIQDREKLNKALAAAIKEQTEAEKAAEIERQKKIASEQSLRQIELDRMDREREAARLEAERAAKIRSYREQLITDEERFTEAIKVLRQDRADGLITEMEYLQLATQKQREYIAKTKQAVAENASLQKEFTETVKGSFESNFASISDIVERGSDAVKDSVKNMVAAVIDHMFKLLVIQPIANALANAVGGFIFGGGGAAAPASGLRHHPATSGIGSYSPTSIPYQAGYQAPLPASQPLPSVAPNHPGFASNPGVGVRGITQINNFQSNVAGTARAEIQAAIPTIVAQTEAAVMDAQSRNFASRYQ